jgi:hypothetical protein
MVQAMREENCSYSACAGVSATATKGKPPEQMLLPGVCLCNVHPCGLGLRKWWLVAGPALCCGFQMSSVYGGKGGSELRFCVQKGYFWHNLPIFSKSKIQK